MCQPGYIMVAQRCDKDLGFVFEAAEGIGIYDAVAVTLKIRS